MRYEFNERELTGANRYREDYSHKEDYSRLRQIDSLTAADSLHIERMKAFVQQYYKHLNDHDFLPK